MKKSLVSRGSEAELIVATYLTKTGFLVSFPISHSSDYDLICDSGSKLFRVQVKRCYEVNNHGSSQLCVETRKILVKHSGLKRSVANRYSENSFDFLIACECDENNFWIIPMSIVLTYKAQIYLRTSKMEFYKNNWNLLS